MPYSRGDQGFFRRALGAVEGLRLGLVWLLGEWEEDERGMGRTSLWAAEHRKSLLGGEEKIKGRQNFNFNESKGGLLIQGNRIKTE